MSVETYMRPQDIAAFQSAAKHYKVWIVLRKSNDAAKQYIGRNGYVPKRLDCKAKSADQDVTLPGVTGKKKLAGLVVDITIPGMLQAFDDLEDVHSSWEAFKGLCYIPEKGASPKTYFPGGKLYSVQMDPAHEHYGCVIFSSYSNVANGKYIHSDYDLYGIVREDDPTTNVRVFEQRLEQKHTRSQLFFDVQHYLNKRMGVAMILHGEQETFKEDYDDKLDVFFPDGQKVESFYGADRIRKLYRDTFQGRKMFGKNATPKPLFGQWTAV